MTDYNNPELYTRIDHDNGRVEFVPVEKKEPQFLQEWDENKVKYTLLGDGCIEGGKYRQNVLRGRGFRTKEDAETFRDAEQMRMKMRRAAAESWGDEEWEKSTHPKESIIMVNSKDISTMPYSGCQFNQPVFKHGTAQAFIDSVGEEELIKAWRW